MYRPLKKGKNHKRKVYEKFNNVTAKIIFFTSVFCLWKRLQNIVWENVVYTIIFAVNFF